MTDVFTERDANRMRVSALALIPAAIIAFVIVLTVAGSVALWPILIGAGGWLAALVLRQPVALIANRRLSREKAAHVVGWFSGPAEELVRVLLVVLTVATVHDAVWFGYGWAAIEVLLIAVNVVALASVLTKDDPKSVEARELLAAQGMLRQQSPVWGFVERISATALHIGFTLLLFANPWFVLVTLPVHSVTNMLAVRYGKTHLLLTELGLAIAGALALSAGIFALSLG